MRVAFIHGFAGCIDDARARGILGRDVEFYSECLRRGIEPIVISLDATPSRELIEAGCEHVVLGASRGASSLAGQRRRLRRVISEAQADKVVADVTAAPLVAWNLRSGSYVCRYEWNWSAVARIEDRGLERVIKRAFETAIMRGASCVLCSTRSLASEAEERGARRTAIAPVFVAAPFFEVTRPQRSSGDLQVLCVGRHVAVKRFDIAVCAVGMSSNASAITLNLVGDGPERERLTDMAQAAGIRFVDHGVVRNDELPELFSAADLLLHPSLNEGMPRVVLEAMAAGLPVLLGKSTGAMDVTGPDGERGVLVGDSAAEWAHAIDAALPGGVPSDDVLGRATRARSWAESTVSVAACVGGYAKALGVSGA